MINGNKLYDENKEFSRQGAFEDKLWRISEFNEKFDYCKSYPAKICVPIGISDDVLKAETKLRSKGRLPALSWYNSKTGVSLTRCAQPLIGILKKSNEDEKFIELILKSNKTNSKKLYIVDLRPKINAVFLIFKKRKQTSK
jgi:hypothetical protein